MTQLQELLQKVDSHQLWQAEIRGAHLWSIVRYQVLSTVISQEKNLQKNFASEGWKMHLHPRILSYHLYSLYKLLLRQQPDFYDALLFKKARDYSIYRAYYERIPQPLIIDRVWRGQLTNHAWKTQDTLLMDTLRVISFARRPFIRLTTREEQTIRAFADQLTEIFPISTEADALYVTLKSKLQTGLVVEQLLKQYIIPQLRNSFALVHQAYYLNQYGIITKTLRKAGVTTAEVQHGTIFQEHIAYNYSSQALTDSHHPLCQYAPDIFLTFGDFWNKQVSIPGDIQTIGHPYLSEKLSTLSPCKYPGNTLIVSQGTFYKQLSDITESLARAYPDSTFFYKLHPEEIAFARRYNHLRQLPNVQVIDYQISIHDFLEKCETIIGVYSTVLFEAVAYPQRRIFMLASDFIDTQVAEQIGTVISSTEEIVDIFQDDTKGHPQVEAGYIWEPDWQTKLDDFLHTHIPSR